MPKGYYALFLLFQTLFVLCPAMTPYTKLSNLFLLSYFSVLLSFRFVVHFHFSFSTYSSFSQNNRIFYTPPPIRILSVAPNSRSRFFFVSLFSHIHLNHSPLSSSFSSHILFSLNNHLSSTSLLLFY